MGGHQSKIEGDALQSAVGRTVAAIKDYADFRRIVGISSGKYVVVDFWAHNCAPCHQIAPVFEKHSKSFPHAEFYKVNVDDHPKIADEAKIKTMPTFVIFKDGKKKAQLKGADPSGLLVGTFNSACIDLKLKLPRRRYSRSTLNQTLELNLLCFMFYADMRISLCNS
ncbi:Thioredoxin domain-containing protein [Rhizoctonia solani AG-1 IA]|uniref:Thioredoxin domain-containing protein n=1 Tax=Thanatephorus cucumeris (strain AG1-IA) TaxID=983506 RepID=L8WMY8_THACA|nr:Thioredoxin domain-containing protein [Rhizoctonia solani AG-1 IA]